MAVIMTIFMVALYVIPTKLTNSNLKWQEWCIVAIWALCGTILYFVQYKKHKNEKALLDDYIENEV